MSAAAELYDVPPALRPRGRGLALRVYVALRALRGHGDRNETFTDATRRLAEEVDELLPLVGGRIDLRFHEQVLLLNGATVPPSSQGAAQLVELAHILLEKDIGGLRFDGPPEPEVLIAWLRLAGGRPADDPEALARTWEALAELELRGLVTHRPRVLAPDAPSVVRVSSRAFALASFARAIVGFREVVSAVQDDREPFGGKIGVVRVVQDLVDVAAARPENLREVLLRRLVAGPRFEAEVGGYAAVHAASVCGWSLLVGGALRLRRLDLLDLGTSALLSKVGYALLPDAITQAPGRLDPGDVERVRRASARAARALLVSGRLGESTKRRLIVAYEHQEAVLAEAHPYTRIVAVADAFDAMTVARPWRPALSVAAALEELRRGAGEVHDPLPLRLLEEALTGR